jgi:hypothetical protein
VLSEDIIPHSDMRMDSRRRAAKLDNSLVELMRF